ncbi:MAG: OmpA family protein [bacterium]
MLVKILFKVTIFSLCLNFALLSQAQGEDKEKAKELFQKALGLRSEVRNACSVEVLRQKEYFYSKAIELYPDYAEAHNNLGDVYENLERYEDAITQYQEVVNKLRPDASDPYFGLGDVYFKTGRYEEAKSWYEKGLKLNPDNKLYQLYQKRLSHTKAILNDIDKYGVIQAETTRGVLGRVTTRTVDGIRDTSKMVFRIHFDYNRSTISKQAIPQLNEIGKALSSQKLAKVKFKIAGHTDSRGSREYNQTLSEKRAESVKKYLIAHFSIPAEKLITRGYGEDRPVVNGNDEASYALNRRVEIERVEEEDLPIINPPRLSLNVSFLYEKDGKPAKMWNNMTLTSKDNYKVYFKPEQLCYVYIFQKDTSGKMTQLFPNAKFTPEKNPVKNIDYWIPKPDTWFYLDETIGKETIFLLATKEPAEDIIHIASRGRKDSASGEIGINEAEASEIEFQIKTRGLGDIRPKSIPNKKPSELLPAEGSFYKEITFWHK